MKPLFVIITAISFLAISGCSRSNKGGELVRVSPDDAAMNDAIAKAKATSGDFIRAFHEQKLGTRDFYVKKPYSVPFGGAEHLWIYVLGESNGILNGFVDSTPEETKEVKKYQTVSLNILEISDWNYVDGNKLRGGFTIRYIFEKMSPKEQEEFRKKTGWDF